VVIFDGENDMLHDQPRKTRLTFVAWREMKHVEAKDKKD